MYELAQGSDVHGAPKSVLQTTIVSIKMTPVYNNVTVTMNCPITISVKVTTSTKVPSCSINNFINCGLVSTQG